MPIRFIPAPAPRASIVILAHSNTRFLDGCLRSLLRDQSATPREVILLLNGATKEVQEFVHDEVTGATVLRSSINLGFAGGCNVAARSARGEFLVLLNDDIEAEAGWLDSLVELADRDCDAGAIGSRILFPDGRLQEAGSVIWDDGSTTPIGRGLDFPAARFQVVREVDFVSACALLIRHSTWRTAGGLCEDYHPAYYEDVDLSMTIRQLGQKVLYAPQSRVRHHESASSDSGFRTFLIKRNQALFRAKWAAELMAFEKAAPESPRAVARADMRARRCHHRVLIVDDRLPDAAVGSGHGRLDEAADRLTALRYAVDFWPADQCLTLADQLGRRGVRVIGGDLRHHVEQPGEIYDAIIVSRPHNFERFATLLRRHQPQAALIYDAEALFHVRLQRQIGFTQDPALAAAIASDAERMRTTERAIRDVVDAIVSVSVEEASYFENTPGAAPVIVLPPLVESARWTSREFDRRHGAVFVAGWLAGNDSPNVDGLRWFVADVLPLIRRVVPGIQVVITGVNPPGAVVELSSSSVRLVGHVADLHGLYDAARVAISPVRFGAGVKVKTVEALQHGVPVVATTVGAEGLELEGSAAVSIGDTAAEFAQALVSLVTDPGAWQEARDATDLAIRALRRHGDAGKWEAVVDAALLTRTPAGVRARLEQEAELGG